MGKVRIKFTKWNLGFLCEIIKKCNLNWDVSMEYGTLKFAAKASVSKFTELRNVDKYHENRGGKKDTP